MTSITVQDGQIVLRDGAIGTEEACCCDVPCEDNPFGDCECCDGPLPATLYLNITGAFSETLDGTYTASLTQLENGCCYYTFVKDQQRVGDVPCRFQNFAGGCSAEFQNPPLNVQAFEVRVRGTGSCSGLSNQTLFTFSDYVPPPCGCGPRVAGIGSINNLAGLLCDDNVSEATATLSGAVGDPTSQVTFSTNPLP
jgi:hypothetical protein